MAQLNRDELRTSLLAAAREVDDSERLHGKPSDASLWHLSSALSEVLSHVGFTPEEMPNVLRLLIKAPELR